MNLYELQGTESNPVYQAVAASNNAGHYDFLLSMVQAAIDSNKPWLSESLIKAINFHAIVALHDQAGQYRSVPVQVGDHYFPPEPYRVQSLGPAWAAPGARRRPGTAGRGRQTAVLSPSGKGEHPCGIAFSVHRPSSGPGPAPWPPAAADVLQWRRGRGPWGQGPGGVFGDAVSGVQLLVEIVVAFFPIGVLCLVDG